MVFLSHITKYAICMVESSHFNIIHKSYVHTVCPIIPQLITKQNLCIARFSFPAIITLIVMSPCPHDSFYYSVNNQYYTNYKEISIHSTTVSIKRKLVISTGNQHINSYICRLRKTHYCYQANLIHTWLNKNL